MKPWFWRSLPLQHRTGSEVFAALFLDAGKIATLLESPYNPLQHSTEANRAIARYSICAGAPRLVDGAQAMWTPPVGEILPFLRRLLQRSAFKDESIGAHSELPFTGGWLGWLGYDLAWEIEQLPNLNSDPLPFPVAYWYEPASFAVLDHWKQTLWLAASDEAELDSLQSLLEQKSRTQCGIADSSIQNPKSPHFHFWTPQTDYEDAVRQAKKYIQAGDIFQANLSIRFESHITAHPWAIYQALHQINPSPFASYWQTPWGALISCSPERLVQMQDRQAQTRPIAGTRSRGTTPALDEHLAQDLIANAKERAEHIMLVDLERNDLGRVCEWGSVEVNELFTIERYSHVMHLVSNVIGKIRPNYDAVDLIRAFFPGGTITGCPKVRCMEIIEELEPVRRNLFYGSCGFLDWRGDLDLNILIRTLLYPNRADVAMVYGQVGAGIVADSDPEREWHESLHKAQALLAALGSFNVISD
ncbi:anthranilate synthase component I [Coleofasciculus sp. H7-2]|uniref:anthranilate synthase component I n=1 Tax=Coleofasciculus sp. H7-2 TaxID=3351545 RepID=UPI00366ABFA7